MDSNGASRSGCCCVSGLLLSAAVPMQLGICRLQVWLTKQDEQTAQLLCAFELQPHNQASPESDLGILNSGAQ